MAKEMPYVGVTLSPQVQPNTDWYARTILKSNELIPTSTAPTSLAYNIAPRTYSFSTRRGRTYDLGRLEAGQCSLKVDNSDGIFDPSNTSSPLYPNVAPYRPLRITAAYPRTGNILNDTNKGYVAKRTIQLVSAVGNGTQIVYTAVGQIPFHQGQVVSVTGMGAANATSQTLYANGAHAITTTFILLVSGFTGTVTAGGYVSLDLPATLTDGAVSVCANDSNFDLGVISNWYDLGGATYAASTTYARSGTYSLSVTSGSVYLDVPCVAGQSVCFSTWVRRGATSASGVISIYAGGYINSSTSASASTAYTATAAFTRVNTYVTATAPKITIRIDNTSGVRTWFDDIQVEFGTTPTTNTTTGSTIYNLFNGFVERYPQSYQAPNRGEVDLVATDVVAMMSQNIMLNGYESVVIQDTANLWYLPLNETSSLSSAVTKAVGNGTTYTYTALNAFEVGQWVVVSGLSSLNVAGTITAVTPQTFTVAGATVATVTNANGSATVSIAYNQNQSTASVAYGHTNTTNSSIELGNTLSEGLLGFEGETCAKFNGTASTSAYFQFDNTDVAFANAYTMDAWVNFSTAGTFFQVLYDNGNITVKVTGNTLSAVWTPTSGTVVTSTLSGTTYPLATNTWELVRLVLDGTNMSVGLVGKAFTTPVATTANIAQTIRFGSILSSGFVGCMKAFRLCNWVSGTSSDGVHNGTQVVPNLFTLGATGNFNDSTGVRAEALMDTYSGFPYVPVSARLGAFTMQQMHTAGKSLFDVMQATSQSEFGYWFVDGAGVINFMDIWERWLVNPPVQTFGDGTGETPYSGAEVSINYDLTYVYNQVEITRANGGRFYSQDIASIDAYFPRTLNLSVENATDAQVGQSPTAFPMAESYLEKYKEPQLRPDHLILTPFRNPAIWNIALGLEVGDYIKFVKRPLGAPEITVYGWVEQIDHNFDGQTSDWITTVSFSPAPAPVP